MAFGTVKVDTLQSASSIVDVDDIVAISGVASGQTPVWNGTSWEGEVVDGQTDLSYTIATRELDSSTGSGVILPLATTSGDGLFSAIDKAKLDSIASGSTSSSGTVTSVGLTVPSGLVASGSPVTTSGTLAMTYASGFQAFTTAESAKLATIASGADVNVPTNLTYSGDTRTINSSTGSGVVLPLVSTSSAGLQPATGFGTITYASSVALDLAARDGQVATITLTGSLELTTSNLATGRSTGLRLIPGASSRTLTFPTDWVFVSAKPASLPANKVARLSIECHGTTNADVVAAIAIQP
jgi:hypothetical protein